MSSSNESTRANELSRKKRVNRNTDVIKDIRRLRLFVEELRWLFATHSKLDLEKIEMRLQDFEEVQSSNISDFAPRSPNTRLLVGVLPAILTDNTIFKSNEEIANFSEATLGLYVPRWEKKSKYEIIGHIVCNAGQLNDEKLGGLVRALTKIVSGDREARRVVRNAKSANLGWNSIIQKLTDW